MLSVIGACVTGFLIQLIISRVGADRLKKMDYWLRKFIAADETARPDRDMGETKMDWVLQKMKSQGMKFDDSAVREAIRGLCRELTAEGVINTYIK